MTSAALTPMNAMLTAKQRETTIVARRTGGARRAAALFAAALLGGASNANAAPPAGAVPSAVDLAPAASASLDPAQRPDPVQYRGRLNYATAGETLAWIPRAALFPLALVTELGVRRPIYAAAEWTDRHHLVPIVERVLRPTPDISWSPTLSLDLSTVTFIGAKGRFNNLGVPGHELRLAADFGGIDAWHYKGKDTWQLGRSVHIGARGEASTRPDRAFYGFGPRSSDFKTSFSLTRYEGFAFARFEPDNHVRVEVSEGYRSERTAAGSAPSIETRFSPADIPGFGGLDLAMAMLDLKLDTRRAREENDGLFFLGNVTYGRDIHDAERSFVSAEVDVEGALEISYPDRVLAARVYAMDTFALGREPVPFMYQATLGWDNHYGFTWGRFRGESALMAQLQYRYPIAYYVDAQWTVSAGNVFNQRFSDFTPGALTGSIGVGLRTRRTGSDALQLTFALGTSRFDERFEFNNVRVYFGTVEGL